MMFIFPLWIAATYVVTTGVVAGLLPPVVLVAFIVASGLAAAAIAWKVLP